MESPTPEFLYELRLKAFSHLEALKRSLELPDGERPLEPWVGMAQASLKTFREAIDTAYLDATSGLTEHAVRAEEEYYRRGLLLLRALCEKRQMQVLFSHTSSNPTHSQKASGNLVLRDVRRRMEQEIGKLSQIESGLHDISSNIRKATSLFESYRHELKKASAYLGKFMQKAEEDGRYLRWSWMFLCAVCAYVIVKRFGLLKVAYLIYRLARSISGAVYGWNLSAKSPISTPLAAKSLAYNSMADTTTITTTEMVSVQTMAALKPIQAVPSLKIGPESVVDMNEGSSDLDATGHFSTSMSANPLGWSMGSEASHPVKSTPMTHSQDSTPHMHEVLPRKQQDEL